MRVNTDSLSFHSWLRGPVWCREPNPSYPSHMIQKRLLPPSQHTYFCIIFACSIQILLWVLAVKILLGYRHNWLFLLFSLSWCFQPPSGTIFLPPKECLHYSPPFKLASDKFSLFLFVFILEGYVFIYYRVLVWILIFFQHFENFGLLPSGFYFILFYLIYFIILMFYLLYV